MDIEFSFKNFLEGRGGVVTGGAFGKFGGLGTPRYQQNQPRTKLNDKGDYNSRIVAGKGIENEICERLKSELGWLTEPASANEDKFEGIDGWITSMDNGKTKVRLPFQIKARKSTSGNDILWEAIKPWNRSLINTFEGAGDSIYTGKDMRSKAQYLISTSSDGGTIRVRYVKETIEKAKELVKELILNSRATGNSYATTSFGQARIVKDPSQQSTYSMSGDIFKVNCFIHPDAFSWKQDFKLKKPIGLV